MTASIANYIIAALCVTATAISAGISQGLTNRASLKAIDLQPAAQDNISKLALISSALIETSAIIGVFVAMLLLIEDVPLASVFYSDLAKMGVGFAIVSSGMVVGLASAWPAQEACLTTARQPFHAQSIFNFTLIVLSILQTPLILAFIVAWLIKAQALSAVYLADSLRLIGAGIAIGVGSIGPVIGLAHFSRMALRGIGINRNAYTQILTFTFISQAIIESPVIFAMITSLVLLFSQTAPDNDIAGIAMLAAGIATGLGMFGPGLSSARTAASACYQIAFAPEHYGSLSRTSIFAQGVIDTAAIYVLLLSLMTIFII